MRYWLWRRGPAVIRAQLRFKSDLKALGLYPSPMNDERIATYIDELIELDGGSTIRIIRESRKFANMIEGLVSGRIPKQPGALHQLLERMGAI